MINLSISNDITKGYANVIAPLRKLADYTKQYNYSSSAYENNYRKGDNVYSLGNCLIYDFDDGEVTVDEIVEYLTDNKVSSVVATSKSHQIAKNDKPACDRFRLFVPLNKTLTITKDEYSLFYMFVARVLNIDDLLDGACKDVARFYYPNNRQEVHMIETGYILDTNILQQNFALHNEKIKEDLKKPNPKPAIANNCSSTGLKSNEVPRDTVIELKYGEVTTLAELDYLQGDQTVPCRCINPSHEDRNPSAFVGRSRTGGALQVTCRSCGYTAYMGKE